MKGLETQVTERFKFFLKNARRLSYLALGLFLVLGAIAAASLTRLSTAYSVKQFLPHDHPLMLADDKLKDRFQLPEVEPYFALITLSAQDSGDFLEPRRIEALKSVTEKVSRDDNVLYAISIATVEGASSSKEGLTVGRLLQLTPQEKWRERILTDPILTPKLLTKDARTVVVAVGLNPDMPQTANRQTMDLSREQIQSAFPNAQVRLGGVPAVQTEMSAVLGKELRNFLGLSLLASVFTLLLFFRSFSSVIIPMLLLMLANFVSLGWMVWFGISFTVLSSTLPVLVALTVVSMSAHTMLRYASDWELAKRSYHNPNPIRVLFESYRGLFLPNFLTAITTGIGFFAIGLAKTPLIRQYGITVGVSIFICWAVVASALLPLLVVFPIPKVRTWTEARATWALWVVEQRRWVIAGVLSLAAFCLFLGKDLNWSSKLFDDLPKGYEARSTTEFVGEHLGGMVPLDLTIEKDEENAWNDPEALRTLDKLAVQWRMHKDVGSVVGPQDLLRAAGKVQGRDLASTRQEAAEYSFLYSFSDNNPLKNFVTADGRAARVNLRLRDIPGDEMEKVVAGILMDTKNAFPNWKVNAGGMSTTVHELNNELCKELIFGFWQAILAITIVLAFVFRSIRWAVAAAIPNLMPVVILLGALSIGGTPIKPGIALIFSIALGISFDNTVYLLGRLRLLRDRSETGRICVAKAWWQEANLCFFSSLALTAGFCVFLASFFAINQQFGAYMVIALLGAMLGDLVFMPAMLAAFPWMVKDKKAGVVVQLVKELNPSQEEDSDKAVV
jgi:predicted RND superfamily exporter protein